MPRHSRRAPRFVPWRAAAALLAAMLLPAGMGEANDRHITFAPILGARWFEGDLDLESDIAFGARVGMELSPRWGVLFDFVASHPIRTSSGREVVIDAMRVLGRANLMTGTTRPYLTSRGTPIPGCRSRESSRALTRPSISCSSPCPPRSTRGALFPYANPSGGARYPRAGIICPVTRA